MPPNSPALSSSMDRSIHKSSTGNMRTRSLTVSRTGSSSRSSSAATLPPSTTISGCSAVTMLAMPIPSHVAILVMASRTAVSPARAAAPAGIVYQKGGWVLHMLRGVIGTEKFWAGIREYYRRFRDANASTLDLRRVMEETSGADLGWFFEQWLLRPASPIVSGGWTYNPAARRIEIDLAQTQSGAAYRLPLEIAIIVAGAPPAVQRIECTLKSQKFQIAAAQEPSSVELDPNVRVLM